MDSARQLIRWGLPGWMTLLFWTIFVILEIICELWGNINAATLANSTYYLLLQKVERQLVPLGAASIPLGFFIYQIYYWMYWYAPVPSFLQRRFINPVDRGKEILHGLEHHVDFKKVFDHPLVPEKDGEIPQSAFKKRWGIWYKSPQIMSLYRQNWHLSESVWYLALANTKCSQIADFLEKRNQMLSDIYHALGACYYSLVFGYAIFLAVLYNVSSAISTRNIIGFIINLIAFALFQQILRGCRISSFDALLALKHDIAWHALRLNPKDITHIYE